jgi:hypothetical protein
MNLYFNILHDIFYHILNGFILISGVIVIGCLSCLFFNFICYIYEVLKETKYNISFFIPPLKNNCCNYECPFIIGDIKGKYNQIVSCRHGWGLGGYNENFCKPYSPNCPRYKNLKGESK